MSNHQIKFPVIIPSVIDDAGLADDYFELGNINLLPMVEKTTIEYIVNDLRRTEFRRHVGDIHIVVASKYEYQYKRLFSNFGDEVHIHPYSPAEKRGILFAVEKVARTLSGPFFIYFGDTLIKDEVLAGLIERAVAIEKTNTTNWAMTAFARDDINNHQRLLTMDDHELERNRWGYIIAQKNRPKSEIVTQEDILEIIYRPSYVSFIDVHESEDIFIETGIMIVSRTLWALLVEGSEIDPLGKHSIINAARDVFIDKKTEIVLQGLVIEREDWLDINYPWEYLLANDYLFEYMAQKDTKANLEKKLSPQFMNVSSTDELIEEYRKMGIRIPRSKDELPLGEVKLRFSHEYWPQCPIIHRNAKIDGNLIIPRPREDETLAFYLGDNALIQGNCVIKNGAIVKSNATVINSVICEDVLIDNYCLIDHSVIMSGARILARSTVPYSVVGENAKIGGHAVFACERIDNAKLNKYYASDTIVKYCEKFGAIVGDGAILAMKVSIHPGRKIGKNSILEAGSEIVHNCQPSSTVKQK